MAKQDNIHDSLEQDWRYKMGFVTSEKKDDASKEWEKGNESAYRKWESERRWLIRFFWFLVSLYVFVFVVCPIVYPFV